MQERWGGGGRGQVTESGCSQPTDDDPKLALELVSGSDSVHRTQFKTPISLFSVLYTSPASGKDVLLLLNFTLRALSFIAMTGAGLNGIEST